MRTIDNFLNKITMYRVVLYGLALLAGLSFVFSLTGMLSVSPTALAESLFLLFVVCYTSNYIFSLMYGAPINAESSSITALILFFVLTPAEITFGGSWIGLMTLALAGIFAMASKYVFAIRRKHIFNPVAVAIFILGLLGSGAAIWWVGSTVLLIPVCILGFLILRKTRRFEMFFAFLGAAVVTGLVFAFLNHANLFDTLTQIFTSWPVIFFGAVMLTEPLTTPPFKKLQIMYALVVGILFAAPFQVGIIYATPGLALLLGNILSYIISPKVKLMLALTEKREVATNIYEFVFKPVSENGQLMDAHVPFKAGQYMEWTLAHSNVDNRGNRRYFTVASSPTETDVRLGIRIDPKGSSFKRKLVSLVPGDRIVASQIAGDFTLPADYRKKLVFISGGIGVTPFRSMLKYLIDKGEKRDIVNFYSNRTAGDIAYADILSRAENEVGVRNVYALTDLTALPQGWQGQPGAETGMVGKDMIQKYAPDYRERVFYISGPHGMVTAFQDMLAGMGVPSSQIKADFFPGFA